MNLDKLKELASDASQIPWEPSPSDVPLSVRWAFREAVRPEVVLALIEVAEKARALIQYPEVAQTIKSEPLAEALSRLDVQ